MIRIAIFASGSGSNAENIANYFSRSNTVKVALVVSNKADAIVHKRAKRLGIASLTFSKQDFEDGQRILETLRDYEIDLIVLAGFLLKIPATLIEAYPQKIMNIHPALLPKYGGKGMYGDNVHKAVVAAGDEESGITIHYVNEHYDEGQIIFQSKCRVLPGDTFEDVARKVHELEYMFFPQIIEAVTNRQEL